MERNMDESPAEVKPLATGQPPGRVLGHSSLRGRLWTARGDGRTGGEAEDHREFFRWSPMGPHLSQGRAAGTGVGRAGRERRRVEALQALTGQDAVGAEGGSGRHCIWHLPGALRPHVTPSRLAVGHWEEAGHEPL